MLPVASTAAALCSLAAAACAQRLSRPLLSLSLFLFLLAAPAPATACAVCGSARAHLTPSHARASRAAAAASYRTAPFEVACNDSIALGCIAMWHRLCFIDILVYMKPHTRAHARI